MSVFGGRDRHNTGVGLFSMITDSYSRTARLMPALLVALPVSLTAIAAVPVAASWWGRVSGLIIASGVPVLVTQVVRDRGRRAQEALFESWGGPPTTAFLRWSGPESKRIVARRHELLARLTDSRLPDERAETLDPVAADEEYAMATTALRELTRSDQFPLVLKENISYGFRRNLFGCRELGIGGALVAAAAVGLLEFTNMRLPTSGLGVLLAFDALSCIVWWRIVTADWVRRAAEFYASRLLDSLEALASERNQ